MRIVLDTSALISAIRSQSGASAEVLRYVILGKLTLLLDYKLVSEYREVVFRPSHFARSGKTRNELEALADLLEDIADPVFVAFKHRPLSSDADDDMVLDVAINGAADAIVTNNVRDFEPAARLFDIRGLTPRDFLIAVRKGQSGHAFK